jgi:hypothetical protein
VNRLRRFRELPADERRLFVAALLLLPIVRVGLGIAGFRRTCGLITRLFPLRPAAHEGRAAERRTKATMRIVATAAAHGACRARCLPRSLAGFALLRRQGLDARIRLGARTTAGVMEAHAWVEVGAVGVDANPDGVRPFVPFAALQQPNTVSGWMTPS